MRDPRRYLEKLFNIITEIHASDLHLSADRRPILRIDGKLYEIEEENILSAEEVRILTHCLVGDQLFRLLKKQG